VIGPGICPNGPSAARRLLATPNPVSVRMGVYQVASKAEKRPGICPNSS